MSELHSDLSFYHSKDLGLGTIAPARLISVTMTALLSIILGFAVMHVVSLTAPSPFDRLEVWFDLNKETSVAAWFSASQLLLVGLLFGFAAWRRWHDRTERRLLTAIALGFVFLSADEAAMIHERITLFTVEYDLVPRFPGGHGVWIFAYGALGCLLVALFWRSILLFVTNRRLVAGLGFGGFAILLLGAVGLEVSMYYDLLTGPVQTGLEEVFEMTGGAFMLCGALVLVAPMVILPRQP